MKNNEKLQRLLKLQEDETNFNRSIGFFGSFCIMCGIIIGMGLFFSGHIVLINTGLNLGLATVTWFLVGIFSLISALCYAELGSMFPRSGGSNVYLREAYHPSLAFSEGFAGLFVGASGSIATLALAFAMAVGAFIPIFSSFAGSRILAIVTIMILTIINIFDIKLGSIVQNIFTIAKIIPILVIAALGLFLGNYMPSFNFIQSNQISMSTLGIFGLILAGVPFAIWAYEGWANINLVAEEIKNPKKNLSRSIVLSLLCVTLLYTVFNWGIFSSMPHQYLASAALEGQVLGFLATEHLLGGFGLTFIVLGTIVSTFGSLNGMIMVFPRMYYTISNDIMLTKPLGKLHKKYKTPTNALIVSAIISCALVVLSLEQLMNLVVFNVLIYRILVLLSVFIFRHRYPELKRPYKTWGFPITNALAIIISLGILVNMFIQNIVINNNFTQLYGVLAIVVGILVYFVSNRIKPKY